MMMVLAKTKPRAAFTLVEVLVAATLLAGSLVAAVTLWGLSRGITERSRQTAEYYIIGCQETERYRSAGFDAIFNSTTVPLDTPRYADYDQNGAWLAAVSSLNSSVTTSPRRAFYRAESVFSLDPTTAADPLQRLGVQAIRVFPIRSEGNVLIVGAEAYRTVICYTAAGF